MLSALSTGADLDEQDGSALSRRFVHEAFRERRGDDTDAICSLLSLGPTSPGGRSNTNVSVRHRGS